MKIADNLEEWNEDFRSGWLKGFKQNQKINWDLYSYVKNITSIKNSGIDLSKSRLMLISSAGGYLLNREDPFDAANPLGDYSIRLLPVSTTPGEIDFAHEHYDTTAVKKDLQVLLHFEHLTMLIGQGKIGGLCETAISFMGYQPDATKVVNHMVPEIMDIVFQGKADAVLLVPS